MTLNPLSDFVLIREETTTSLSGIVLPENTNYKRHFVVAVGPGTKELEPGQEVLLWPSGDTLYPNKFPNHFVIREGQVCAVLVAE